MRDDELRRLAACRVLSAAEKWVIWALWEELGGPGGLPQEILVCRIADKIGMSADRVGAIIMALRERGVVVRSDELERLDESGGWRRRVRVALTLLASNVEALKGKQRRHGGQRLRCQKCGSEDIRRWDIFVCMKCGSLVHKDLEVGND